MYRNCKWRKINVHLAFVNSGQNMQAFQPTRKRRSAPKNTQPKQRKLRAVVVSETEIQWGNWGQDLNRIKVTEYDRELVRRHTGCKRVNDVKVLAVKRCIAEGLNYSETVDTFKRGKGYRSGYSPRTIWGIYSALSKAGGAV